MLCTGDLHICKLKRNKIIIIPVVAISKLEITVFSEIAGENAAVKYPCSKTETKRIMSERLCVRHDIFV